MTQSVVPRLSNILQTPGSLLGMQTLRSHPSPLDQNLHFNKIPREVCVHLTVGQPCFTQQQERFKFILAPHVYCRQRGKCSAVKKTNIAEDYHFDVFPSCPLTSR